jgi:transposase
MNIQRSPSGLNDRRPCWPPPLPIALDYGLKRWQALTRYLEDGRVPLDNNSVENLIRPWAIGRSNRLFVGSLRAGQRGAAIMSLIRSAHLNAHDRYVT